MSRYADMKEIGTTLASAGFECYLVGGAVRDFVLGSVAHDMDLATNARPDDAVRLLTDVADTVVLTGAEFGTITVVFGGEAYEVTTFRGDQYDGESRKPVVSYSDTILDDLVRRDFTINAMAINLHAITNGEQQDIVDPFGGQQDLKDRVLRTPGDTRTSFRDDPLRMMRAARFIARYGLVPAISLETVCRQEAHQLGRVSVERIRDELMKLLLVDDPTAGLDFLARTGLSDVFLPELNALRMEDEAGGYKDVYTHTFAVIRNTAASTRLRLAALFHDVAKPATFNRDDGKVSFHRHEVQGATMTENIMRRLKFDNDTTADVTKLVRLHLRVHTADEWTDRAVRRYIRDAGSLLTDLNLLQRADVTTKSKVKAARLAARMDVLEARIAEIQALEGVEPIKPPLDGRQVMDILGIGPGKRVGEVLAALLEHRLDHGPMTEGEASAYVIAFDELRHDDFMS